MIKKFSNITLLCWIFSQDVIYKLNFIKKNHQTSNELKEVSTSI